MRLEILEVTAIEAVSEEIPRKLDLPEPQQGYGAGTWWWIGEIASIAGRPRFLTWPRALTRARRSLEWTATLSTVYGRDVERNVLGSLLRGARDGCGGGLVVHGDPGIGKTTLLAWVRQAAADMRVLASVGVEAESELGYAALHRLLRPVLDRRNGLPGPQARALDIVFGQDDGPAPDRFLVALAVLSLLSDLAAEGAVLCVVDDVHWVDRASRDTLMFVARRLEAEPIAVVLAARRGEGVPIDTAGLDELPVEALDGTASRTLLLEHGGSRMTRREQDEVLHAGSGNPLAIRELAASGRGHRHGEPLPLTEDLQRAFLNRVIRHSPAARTLLLLIAADGSGRFEVLRRAAHRLGADLTPLDRGELDDLVVADNTAVTFRHPLIRSAVYHAANLGQRRAAHEALAEALARADGEHDRRAWHLGQAAREPDEHVAVELERSAHGARRRAGPAAAAAALARAGELSPSAAERIRRTVAAAECWFDAGDTTRALELMDQVDLAACENEPVGLDAIELRAMVELRTGSPRRAVELLRTVIERLARPAVDVCDPVDDRRRLRPCMLLAEAAFLAETPRVWPEILTTLDKVPASGSDDYSVALRLMRGAARTHAGLDPRFDPDDVAALERLTNLIDAHQASGIARGLGFFDLARDMWSKAAQQARSRGAAGRLAWILLFAVSDELKAGHYRSAEAYAEEGNRLASETGQPCTACRHRGLLARINAILGRDHQARQLAEDVIVTAQAHDLPQSLASGHHTLGMLDLVAGRYSHALGHLKAMHRDGVPVAGAARTRIPDLVEAAVRAGEPDRVVALVDHYQIWAAQVGAPAFQALAARARALLGPADAAQEQFHKALDYHLRAGRPFDTARTQLLLGEHLRRERRPIDARPHLRAAWHTFTRLNAPVWAERARAEMRAAGETTGHLDPQAMATLTAQEMRIALAVAEGSTNREVAAQLFLSPRTIDYHLRKIFEKTGITSRTDLVRLVLSEEAT